MCLSMRNAMCSSVCQMCERKLKVVLLVAALVIGGPLLPAPASALVAFEEAKLTASDGLVLDYFGVSVAISGHTVVVGAYGDDDNGSYSGSAYVFRDDGSDWAEEAKLTASDGAESDFFGRSIAVSGDAAVVGAFDDDNGMDSGSAYVFRFSDAPARSDGFDNDGDGFTDFPDDPGCLGSLGSLEAPSATTASRTTRMA